MLAADASMEEIQEFFNHDLFATEVCGCKILEASDGYAVCEFKIQPKHLNAQGGVMGGAIFTLADFALAVACNVGHELSVSINASIIFMSAAKGERLIATAKADKNGHHLGFFTILVEDEFHTPVAKMTTTSYRH